MPMAVSAIYVRHFLPPELKAKTALMTDDLKSGLRGLLNAATGMERVTRDKAVFELVQMLEMAGTPRRKQAT